MKTIERLRELLADAERDDRLGFDLELTKHGPALLAEVAALTERAERAERYVSGQDLRSDYATAAEMRAAVEQSERQLAASRAIARRESIGCDAWSDRAVKAEKANALLRAECEAFREFEDFILDEEPAKSLSEAEEWVKKHNLAHAKKVAARAATDEAGALKGGHS